LAVCRVNSYKPDEIYTIQPNVTMLQKDGRYLFSLLKTISIRTVRQIGPLYMYCYLNIE